MASIAPGATSPPSPRVKPQVNVEIELDVKQGLKTPFEKSIQKFFDDPQKFEDFIERLSKSETGPRVIKAILSRRSKSSLAFELLCLEYVSQHRFNNPKLKTLATLLKAPNPRPKRIARILKNLNACQCIFTREATQTLKDSYERLINDLKQLMVDSGYTPRTPESERTIQTNQLMSAEQPERWANKRNDS